MRSNPKFLNEIKKIFFEPSSRTKLNKKKLKEQQLSTNFNKYTCVTRIHTHPTKSTVFTNLISTMIFKQNASFVLFVCLVVCWWWWVMMIFWPLLHISSYTVSVGWIVECECGKTQSHSLALPYNISIISSAKTTINKSSKDVVHSSTPNIHTKKNRKYMCVCVYMLFYRGMKRYHRDYLHFHMYVRPYMNWVGIGKSEIQSRNLSTSIDVLRCISIYKFQPLTSVIVYFHFLVSVFPLDDLNLCILWQFNLSFGFESPNALKALWVI